MTPRTAGRSPLEDAGGELLRPVKLRTSDRCTRKLPHVTDTRTRRRFTSGMRPAVIPRPHAPTIPLEPTTTSYIVTMPRGERVAQVSGSAAPAGRVGAEHEREGDWAIGEDQTMGPA